jgi:hypothetical protein
LKIRAEVAQREVATGSCSTSRPYAQRNDVPLGRIAVSRRRRRVVSRAAEAERSLDLLDRGVLEAGGLEERLDLLELLQVRAEVAEVAEREVAAAGASCKCAAPRSRRGSTHRSAALSSLGM